MGSGTEITPNLLQAMVHSGAYLSGAFVDEKCVGTAFAFPATIEGLHLHSHMAAVNYFY
jgi:predicted GNAT superfamily acetyltransferase